MKISRQAAAFSAVLFALAAGATYPVMAKADSTESDKQERSMGACLDMSKPMMEADPACRRVIAQMKASPGDLDKMRACRRMGETAMAKSPNCSSMTKRDLESH